VAWIFVLLGAVIAAVAWGTDSATTYLGALVSILGVAGHVWQVFTARKRDAEILRALEGANVGENPRLKGPLGDALSALAADRRKALTLLQSARQGVFEHSNTPQLERSEFDRALAWALESLRVALARINNTQVTLDEVAGETQSLGETSLHSLTRLRSATSQLEAQSGELRRLAESTARTSAELASQSAESHEVARTLHEDLAIAEAASVAAGQTLALHRDALTQFNCVLVSSDEEIVRAEQEGHAAQDAVAQLGAVAETINGLLLCIDRITRQTAIVSLNASVESARAGKAGEGFKVVAGEIKMLSDQTAQAAAQISEVLSNIQRHIADATGEIGRATGRLGATRTELAHVREAGTQLALEHDTTTATITDATSAIKRMTEQARIVAHHADQDAARAARVTTLSHEVAKAATVVDDAVCQIAETANGQVKLASKLADGHERMKDESAELSAILAEHDFERRRRRRPHKAA